MKTVVLALCLSIPVCAWAQKEPVVEPQNKMIKAANQAESSASTAAAGINKGRREQGPGQAAESAAPGGAGAAEKAARPAKQEAR